MQESILSQVQRIIKGEVSLAMKEQQAAVTSSIMQAMRSAAGTPIPAAHLDCQAQQAHILQMLQQGHLNQAFQQVCSWLETVLQCASRGSRQTRASSGLQHFPGPVSSPMCAHTSLLYLHIPALPLLPC